MARGLRLQGQKASGSKKRAPETAPSSDIAAATQWKHPSCLRRVIHFELHRMRRVLEADHFAHLQVDIGIDEVVVENTSGLEEGAVLVELLEGLAERAANGRNLFQFLWRQIVEVLVDCLARIELVLDA